MPQFETYIYLLNNVGDRYDALLNSSARSLIVEAGNTSAVSPPQLSVDQITALQNFGNGQTRHLYAYVNVAVTDAYRAYWQPEWTRNPATMAPFTAADLDRADADIRAPTEFAPDWLSSPLTPNPATGPVSETGGNSIPVYGPIVDFGDGAIALPDDGSSLLDHLDRDSWWYIVISQVQTLLDAGYTGIFLDDVSRYAAASNPRAAAQDMMALVEAVQYQIGRHPTEVSLGINGGGYITGDSDEVYEISDRDRAFFDGIDFLVMENQMTDAPDLLWEVATVLRGHGASTTLVAIEWQDSLADPSAFASLIAQAQNEGLAIDGYFPSDAAYDSVDPMPEIQTLTPFGIEASAFYGRHDSLLGTAADEFFFGLAGNDTVEAGAGNDTLVAGPGDDRLLGQDGNDSILARGGDDRIEGGAGSDTIYGSDGDDTIYGGPGDDLIFAGNGNDLVYGGGGNDTIIGGDGEDSLYGDSGHDALFGGVGSDILIGGYGDDQMHSGSPPDTADFL